MSSSDDRAKALEKVRKLLAMAGDGRGNTNEAEAAARQAAALMAKFNIESAEAQLKDLCSDEPDLDQALVYPSYYGDTVRTKTLPAWAGILAVGVARLTQTKVDGYKKDGYAVARFSGYRTDVVFAEWLFQLLCRAVYDESTSTPFDRVGRNDFRHAAAARLQSRMMELRRQQEQELAASTEAGTALVVVDKKLAVIAEHFGEQRTSKNVRSTRDHSAASAGRQFGDKVAIPGARPLGSTSTHQQLAA